MKIEHFCNQINVSGLFLFVCSPEVQKTLVCCKLYRLAGWGEHSFLPASCGIFWRKGGRQWCSVLKRWQPSCRLILQTIINHKKKSGPYHCGGKKRNERETRYKTVQFTMEARSMWFIKAREVIFSDFLKDKINKINLFNSSINLGSLCLILLKQKFKLSLFYSVKKDLLIIFISEQMGLLFTWV